jgi:hypothetical protein
MAERIPDEALFEPDGHLGELALACIADGEVSLVGAAAAGEEGEPVCAALAHLERCDACTHRLGEVALLSVAAGELLAATMPAEALAPLDLAPRVEPALVVAPASAVEPAALTPRRRRPVPVAAIGAALLLAMVTAGPTLVEGVRGLRGAVTGALSLAPFLGRVALSLLRAPWVEGRAVLVGKLVSAVVLAAIGFQVARVKTRAASVQQGGV